MDIRGKYWKCDSCFGFDLCDECYRNKVVTWSYPGHKTHHSFSMVVQQEPNSDSVSMAADLSVQTSSLPQETVPNGHSTPSSPSVEYPHSSS